MKAAKQTIHSSLYNMLKLQQLNILPTIISHSIRRFTGLQQTFSSASVSCSLTLLVYLKITRHPNKKLKKLADAKLEASAFHALCKHLPGHLSARAVFASVAIRVSGKCFIPSETYKRASRASIFSLRTVAFI